VLLPGLDGTGRLFAPLLAVLPAGVQARVVDYPRDTVLGHEELAARVDLPDEPFLLVGESFSGPVALRIAARRPAGLVGVVLVATFATPPVPRALAALPWDALFRRSPPRAALRHALCGGDATLAAEVAAAIATVAPAVLAGRLRAVLACDAREALIACEVPLLYLQATADRVIPARCGAEIARAGAMLVRVDGPHLLLQTNPRGAWDVLRNAGWVDARDARA
jgi:pimeloyl-[acyl-carrier protein] methyl ester esterase